MSMISRTTRAVFRAVIAIRTSAFAGGAKTQPPVCVVLQEPRLGQLVGSFKLS
jgi:hypothetical protein